ncbi:MAG: hypothetical protein ATN36_05910 [Epulopiscium sp. Nele67-Bin005]|nr:MAG: hypothetical protein ATN36_05910 [Epulopiscium sp. Nele67-Bin005]
MIRHATQDDKEAVFQIFQEASQNFKAQNINQWQGEYPNIENVLLDIEQNGAFVYENGGEILGYFFLTFEADPNYSKIYVGDWLSTKPYGVLHRIVVKSTAKRQGVGQKIFDYAKTIAQLKHSNMRIDTHKQNVPMINLIEKNNYTYCGTIFVEDKTERLAYELIL